MNIRRTLPAATLAALVLASARPASSQAPPADPPAGAAAPAAPPDLDALQRQLDAARKEMEAQKAEAARRRQEDDRLRHQLEEQKIRIESLESKMEGVVREKGKDARPKTGLLSIRNDWFELGGVFEAEYVDVENETQSLADAADAPAGHFQMDRFALLPKVTINEDISLQAELEFKPRNGRRAALDNDPEQRGYLKEGFVRFQNFPGNTWLQAGMDDRFCQPADRMTETHPLAGTAFWRDDTPGITIGGEPLDFVYWRASVTDGLRLGSRGINEDKSFPILHDDRAETDLSDPKEIGFGLGGKYTHETLGRFDLLAFYFGDRLDHDERLLLQSIPGYGGDEDRNRTRMGVNADYAWEDFRIFIQFVGARDGDLDRLAWYVQPSYTWKFEGLRWLQSLTFLYRWNQYEVDLDPVVTSSLTWDRTAHTPAILVEVVPFVTLKFEYTFNFEDTGGTPDDVDNDEFLVHLEVKF